MEIRTSPGNTLESPRETLGAEKKPLPHSLPQRYLLMLASSLFDIVNHIKSDLRMHIAYLDLETISNQKVVNHKVLDLFKLYSFDVKFIFIRCHRKKL
jgi:hypothetical protein